MEFEFSKILNINNRFPVQPRGLLDFLQSADKVPVNEVDLLVPRNNLMDATNLERDKGVIKVRGSIPGQGKCLLPPGTLIANIARD